ncbi:MAG: SMP-30/gluconolactonase/LRE family protein [Mesorhizobium sp.]|nr:SMP-30/gluconolactonase/LRE family protein [Mesorhizobium sp.]MCO5162073.1 SMP-30/gluconolactonase/LRE family protein [Mesorhizobium sp.]
MSRVSAQADLLGESPVWDGRRRRLYWVDGVSRLIRAHDRETGAFHSWTCPSTVGSIALGEGETLVAGLVDGIYRLDLETGAFSPVFRPDPANPAVRFNDGKNDRQGRFLCGSMGIHADPLGKLYRIDKDGRADVFATGIRISNALCFSPDGNTMYFADSLERKIRAYDYSTDDAPARGYRVLIDTEPHGSGPDGATVDAEGGIWACLIQIGKIARFLPDGTVDRMIDAPTDMPSCIAFGGPDLATLFVTSIKDSGSGRAISKHPDGGMLFAIDGLGVRGLPEARFGQPVLKHDKTEVA